MNEQKNIVKEHFSTTSDNYARLYTSPKLDCYNIGYRARKRILLELIGPSRTGVEKILDVGCGPGVLSRELLDGGWHVNGLDVSEAMIERARERVIDHLRKDQADFRTGDVESLPYEKASFDVIVASGLIEYLERPERALAEFERVLKPNGTLILTVPTKRVTYNVFLGCLRPFLKLIGRQGGALPYFHKEWRPRALDRWVKKSGWDVIDRRSYHFIFFPLDHLCPELCVKLALFLDEQWEKSLLFGWLGKGYILKVVKR